MVSEAYAPNPSFLRRALTTTTGWLAAIAGLWTLTLVVSGGIDIDVAGISITSNDSRRTLLYASLLLTIHILAGGTGFEQLFDRVTAPSPARSLWTQRLTSAGWTGWSIVSTVWAAVSVHLGAIIVVVASAYLIYQWTGGRTLWNDEEMILANVRDRGFTELTGALWLGQTAPLGWLYLQRGMMVLFGTSEVALRFVPVFFGIATMATAIWIGRRWMSPIGATALAALCTSGFWLLFHFLELKQYSSDSFWAFVIPALAVAALEPKTAPTRERLRRVAAWWAIASIGQFFSVGAILVMPACVIALLAIVYWRDGWGAALRTALFGVGWLAAFGLHYVLALRAAIESEYLQEYWAPFMPPATAGVIETIKWLANRLGPFADKPGGAEGQLLFWVAAILGVAIAWRQSRLALFFGLVPISALLWTGIGLVPLADRVSLWTIPALYVAIALAIDGAVRFFTRPGVPRLLPALAAGLAGLIGIGAVIDIFDGREFLRRGRPQANHELDDRATVQWLVSQRQPGDAFLSTQNSLPAIWWYGSIPIREPHVHPDGGPVFELDHVHSPCDHRSIATMLSGQRRVLVYLGWLDDRHPGLDDLLLLRFREIGTIVSSRDFQRGRAFVVDLQSGAPTGDVPPSAAVGPSLDASKFEGCLRLRPARRW